ncbi:MAG: beta-N-acetylhexosaminidase, partial [Actinomycetota bacterium]|nr:beta-N-acetylhexosaminidase [Actinomycetota bacterium]
MTLRLAALTGAALAIASAPASAPEHEAATDGAQLAGALPTPAQLAGQRIVYGFDGTRPPRDLLRRIRRGEAAGVILFARNIRSHTQVRAMNAAFQRWRPPGAPPLLVMADQEGGIVKRLAGAPRRSAAELGRIGSESLALAEGRNTARNLRDVGINVDLAPVV